MLQSLSEPNAPTTAAIDIWRIDLNCDSWKVGQLIENLSPDEKDKASKFRFPKDRDHYVVARGSLREIIGSYLDLKPDQIRFSYNKYGKPSIDNGNPALRFNLSHSRDIALVAVTSGAEVGVDVEYIDDELDVMNLANTIFSASEISMLENLSADAKTGAFFNAWTRKEAFLKALGKGFSEVADCLPTSAPMNDAKISVKITGGQIEKSWSLASFIVDRDYSAAVAAEGGIGTIRYKKFLNASKEIATRLTQNATIYI